MNVLLTKLFGPSWRTTISGGITAVACAIAAKPDLVAFLHEPARSSITGLAGIIAFVAGCSFAAVSKDARVSGTPQNPQNPGTQ